MTLRQFRDLTENLPGSTELVYHDCSNESTEPATAFLFSDLHPGDPIRLKTPPNAILISGIGEEVPA